MGYFDQSYPPSIYVPPVPPPVPATGATAGIPGTWTPVDSVPPADVAGAAGIVASPLTAWTTGQYVQTGTAGAAGRTYWDGTDWVAGVAPVAVPQQQGPASDY